MAGAHQVLAQVLAGPHQVAQALLLQACGTRAKPSSPAISSRARRSASLASVLTRSAGFRGVSPGAHTRTSRPPSSARSSLTARAGAHHRRHRVRRASPVLLLPRPRARGPRAGAARAARTPSRRASRPTPAELRDPASVAAVLRAAAPGAARPPGRAPRRWGARSPSRSRPGTSTSAAPSPCSRRCARTRPDVPALVVTSGEVYGACPSTRLPVGADTPLNPVSPYGASKAAADLAAAQYRAAYGLPAFRVRAFNHVGPGQDPRFVLPNVARQIARAERDGLPRSRCAWGTWTPAATSRTCATWCAPTGSSWSAATPTPLYLACRGASTPVRRDHRGARRPRAHPRHLHLRRRRCGARGSSPTSMVPRTGSGRTRAGRPEIPIETTLADTLAWWRERVSQEED